MMPHKYIFFNGPPGSGKDLACSFIYKEYPWQSRHMKFATVLKEGARHLYGIDQTMWDLLEKSGSQEEKNKPRDDFFGKSWREVLIMLSEQHMKPSHGLGVFGAIFARQLTKKTGTNFTVVSDCGFAPEIAEVAKVVGAKNCYVIQLSREGCSFEGDSRSYLLKEELPGVSFDGLNNAFERDMFRRQVLMRVNKILGGDRTYD